MLLLSRLVQWRCRSKLEIKQRHLVIKERLVKTGQRVASCANRIEQLQRRAFTGLQSDLRLILNVVNFCNHSGAVKVDAVSLLLERNQGLVYVAQYLVRKELFL